MKVNAWARKPVTHPGLAADRAAHSQNENTQEMVSWKQYFLFDVKHIEQAEIA